jgi:hypothetical protein
MWHKIKARLKYVNSSLFCTSTEYHVFDQGIFYHWCQSRYWYVHLSLLLEPCLLIPVGFGLVDTLLSKHASYDIVIFAGARDPSKADALKTLQTEYPTKLFIVPYDASVLDGATAAAKVIEERYGYVDVVIGNAGVGGLGKLHEVPLTKVQEFFNVRIFFFAIDIFI